MAYFSAPFAPHCITSKIVYASCELVLTLSPATCVAFGRCFGEWKRKPAVGVLFTIPALLLPYSDFFFLSYQRAPPRQVVLRRNSNQERSGGRWMKQVSGA